MGHGDCSGCGAPLESITILCGFCGTQVPGRVLEVSPGVSVSDALTVIKNNIDALDGMPQPTIFGTLHAVVYWYMSFATLGIGTKSMSPRSRSSA